MNINNALRIDNLHISRLGTPLISLNANVLGGEVLTVMGPSGSGKSTLLNWLAGLLPSSFEAIGSLYLDGEDITHLPANERNIGVLYQDPLLFSHLNVSQNLAFAMTKMSATRRNNIISEQLAQIGLGGYEKRHPNSLSGGQQSRVALLRMLLSEPKAVLLDEPFSKLDSQLREETRRLVFSTIRAHSIPTIVVTHDIEDHHAAGGKLVDLSQLGA